MDVSTPMNSFDKKWLFSGEEEEEGEEGQVQTVRSKMHSASRNKGFLHSPLWNQTNPNFSKLNRLSFHDPDLESPRVFFLAPYGLVLWDSVEKTAFPGLSQDAPRFE